MSRLQKVVTVPLFCAMYATALGTTRYVESKDGCCTRYSQNCTGTEAAPFCTIEDAVGDSDTVDNDSIIVASGEYFPDSGVVNVSKVITIVSAGTDPALERAEVTSIFGTVNFQHGTDTTGRRIEGFTITSQGTYGYNDGIRVSARTVEIVGNIIEDNSDRGVDVIGASGKLVSIKGNIIRGNQNSGVYIATSPAAFEDNQILGNRTPDDSTLDGGGIRLNGPDLVTIANTTIRGNHADHDGGGIHAWGVDTLWLANVILEDNEALNVGGGLYVQGSPAFAMTEVEDPCLSTLYVDLKMQNCLVTCNDAVYGSGIYIADSSEWHIVNSTIAFNGLAGSTAVGGGIYSISSCGTAWNSIVWGNEASSQPQFGFYGDNNVEIGWSIVEDWTSCTAPFNCTGPVSGDDPLFVDPVGDDTEPCTGDENFRLSGDSPAIDAGNNDEVLDDLADLDDDSDTEEPTPKDLDMGPRFVDDPNPDTGEGSPPIVDMGPYEALRCPMGNIGSVTPVDGKRDARQPHPTSNNGFTYREGIGSPNSFTGYADGPEPIIIELDVAGASDLDCWTLCETDIEPMEGGTLDVNYVESVTEVESGVYEILLDRPISAGEWTTIEYFGGGDYVTYSSLPADVNNNGGSASSDILSWIDCCYNTTCSGYDKYRCDLNHSGVVTTVDYLALVDLLNGANAFIVWSGVSLPSNTCPASSMSFGGMGGSVEESYANADFANWVVDYLVDADPVGEALIEDFKVIVTGLTAWCMGHFATDEQMALAEQLTDPGLKFASEAGATAAANMASTLNP